MKALWPLLPLDTCRSLGRKGEPPMEWNLFSLKVFAEVVRQKSFTKAGKTLGLT